MNKLLIAGAVAAPLVLGSGITGGYFAARHAEASDIPDGYARVLNVQPAFKTVNVPVNSRECREVPVTRTIERERESTGWKHASTAAGAVLGVVVGNQIGSGRGRDVARVGGAVIGGKAGHDIYKNTHKPMKEQVTTYETRCKTVTSYNSQTKDDGFDVTFEQKGGQTGTVRMPTQPIGLFIPVPANSSPQSI